MLFASIYTYREPVAASQHFAARLYLEWTPPANFRFGAHHVFADASGGVSLIEADCEATVLATLQPWAPYIDFRIKPVIDIDQALSRALSLPGPLAALQLPG